MTKLGNCTVWWNHYMNIGTAPHSQVLHVHSSSAQRSSDLPQDMEEHISFIWLVPHTDHNITDNATYVTCSGDFPCRWWCIATSIVRSRWGYFSSLMRALLRYCWPGDIVNGDNGQRWPSSSECVCYRTHTDALCHKLCMRHFSRGQCQDIGAAGKGENPCFIPL